MTKGLHMLRRMYLSGFSLLLVAAAAIPVAADDLMQQYAAKINQLLPGMSEQEIPKRKDAQLSFEKMCFEASAPGKDADRKALCSALIAKVGPDTAKPARVWLLKKVETIGRDEVVAGLSPLLHDSDGEIRDLARRAIQNNPSPDAEAALLGELSKAQDEGWRVAVINALGFRRSAKAVAELGKLAAGESDSVASAALAALADIGSAEAARLLTSLHQSAKPSRHDSVVDACLRAAERLSAAGDKSAAVALYQKLDVDSESEAIRIAVLHGLVHSQGSAGLPRLLKAINGKDERIQVVAARLAQELPGESVTAELIKALDSATPEGAVMLLDVLAQRGDAAALPAVVRKVEGGDEGVRIAALTALRLLGNASTVPLLAERAARSSGAERDAARDTLARLKGKDVDAAILTGLNSADPGQRPQLVWAAAKRSIAEALPAMHASVRDGDESVRVAVLLAIGALASKADLSKVVDIIVQAQGDATLQAGEDAAVALAMKNDDEQGRTAPIVAGLSKAKGANAAALVDALGRIRGDSALVAIREAVTSADGTVRQAAEKALAAWKPTYVTKWVFSGPYRQDGKKGLDLVDVVFEPEQPKVKAQWQPLPVTNQARPEEFAIHQKFPGNECCGYVRTVVISAEEQDAMLTLGSDDGVKAWLNGEVVHTRNAQRALRCDEDQVKIRLKKGRNRLLLKIMQGGGDWSVCCGFKAADGGPIAGLSIEAK